MQNRSDATSLRRNTAKINQQKNEAKINQSDAPSRPKVDLTRPGTSKKKAGNTAAYHYFHNRVPSKPCEKDKDRIENECKAVPDSKEKSISARERAILSGNAHADAKPHTEKLKEGVIALDKGVKDKIGFKVDHSNRWMENHCGGLWHKPGGGIPDKSAAPANPVASSQKKKAQKPRISNTKGFRNQVNSLIPEISKDLLKSGEMEDLMACTMAGIAEANPCIKARKCLLIPYNQVPKSDDGSGCCPGQTGHHVLPNAMFNFYEPRLKKNPKENEPIYTTNMAKTGRRKCWSKYEPQEALTICLEGTTNRETNGSHGLAHKHTAALLLAHRQAQDMPYLKARNKITKMLAKMFGCNAKCLNEQLDNSLKEKHDNENCKDLKAAQVSPHSGETGGEPIAPIVFKTPPVEI